MRRYILEAQKVENSSRPEPRNESIECPHYEVGRGKYVVCKGQLPERSQYLFLKKRVAATHPSWTASLESLSTTEFVPPPIYLF